MRLSSLPSFLLPSRLHGRGRGWALPAFLILLTAATPTNAQQYAAVLPQTPLNFPRDHGAHPNFRTEWWYVTGWLRTPENRDLGFQVTFFRTRPGTDPRNPSKFAPNQILFAHAALSDPRAAKLAHAQRIARAGFGLAETATTDAAITLDDWRMTRDAKGIWHTRVAGEGFTLDLALTPTQSVLLQGENGFSQKGPALSEASHYYSLPHLKVSGTLGQGRQATPVTGTAWLDREWSSTLLNPRAIGWDWLGLNMDDGGALTLFQVRDAKGGAVWAGGSYRDKTGRQTRLRPQDVSFAPGRRWRSKRTGATYPVAPVITVMLAGTPRRLPVTPLFDDQELDSRRGGGPVYWEGAVRVPGGRGYLELTGYQSPLKM